MSAHIANLPFESALCRCSRMRAIISMQLGRVLGVDECLSRDDVLDGVVKKAQ